MMAKQRSHANRVQRGLTLVEVLVAMLILSLVAGGVLMMIGQNVQLIASSEERMLARIVADNEMIETLARPFALEAGVTQNEVELGGRQWSTQKTVIETGVGDLLRIDIVVSLKDENQIIASAATLGRRQQ